MREILVKAKIKNWKEQEKQNQWVEGYYCKRKSGHYTTVRFEEEYKDCIIKEFSDGGISFGDVDPETVCQYTELNDNTRWEQLSEDEKEKFLSEWNYEESRQNIKEDWNGKKIFENDIVSAPFLNRFRQYESEIGMVKWGKGTFSFVHVKEEYGRRILGFVSNIRVIGNIFDNPELLKGDDDNATG